MTASELLLAIAGAIAIGSLTLRVTTLSSRLDDLARDLDRLERRRP